MIKKPLAQQIGSQYEATAKRFLQNKGLVFLQSHYRTPMGEIDLIMEDKREIVFVEVRYRKNNDFGEPEETITWHKQQRLIRTALHFQQYHAFTQDRVLRFDIIGISGNQPNIKITWIRDAFGVQ